jgi:hypothetical protein
MKNIFLFLQLSIASVLIFVSCSKEPIDKELSSDIPASCITPSIFAVSTLINDNMVQISWDKSSAEAWEVQYGAEGFVLGTGTIVDFTSTSSSISGLTAGINYEFYIRTKCGNGDYSSWLGPVSPGNELKECTNPTNVTATRLLTDVTKVSVSWLANGDENSWQVQYGNTGFTIGNGTILNSSTNNKVVSNLLENASYDFYVRSNCSSDQNSAWIGPIVVNAFVDPACVAPTNIAVFRNATNNSQAVISWNAGGSETSWEIQYGNVGLAVGTGTSVISKFTTTSITGLEMGFYDFYVRAICSVAQNSIWVGPINLAEASGIGSNAALMTANIAEIQYDNMVPYVYGTTGIDVVVLNNAAPLNQPRYLWIQGVTTDNLLASSEISLYVPNNLWTNGDYALFAFDNLSGANFCQVKLLTNPGSVVSTSNRIIEGRMSITEFNIDNRIVKGTFSFTYEKFVEGKFAGEFRVINGTFSYELDDSYFN